MKELNIEHEVVKEKRKADNEYYELERKEIKRKQEEKEKEILDTIVQRLLHSAQQIDEKQCFEAYKKFYQDHGYFPINFKAARTISIVVPNELNFLQIKTKFEQTRPHPHFQIYYSDGRNLHTGKPEDVKCWVVLSASRFE